MTKSTLSGRLAIAHDDNSLLILPPGATEGEAIAEAAMTSLDGGRATVVRVDVTVAASLHDVPQGLSTHQALA